MAADLIDNELDRIVRSKPFSSSPRLVRFLRYCVEHSRDGRQDCLKETVIGVNVFDRVPCYDPKADPIVRVHARRLRQKLEAFYDAEDAPALVIRVPKGAYIAQFEESCPPKPRPAAVLGPGRARPLATVAGVLACVALALFAARLLRQKQDSVGASIRPLVSLPGAARDPAWSPDGKTVAFSWDGGASRSSRVYLVRNGESVPAVLTEAAQPEHRPAWSPDGKFVALLREVRPHDFSLVIVDVHKKTERLLRDVLQLSPITIPPALDWSHDGRWLVTSEEPSSGAAPAHLVLVSAADGKSWVITDPPDGSTGDLEAKFSPDSKQILFRRGGNGDLLVLSLNGSDASQPVALTTNNPGVRGLGFAPDGGTIFFGSRNDSSRFGIWSMRGGSKSPVRLTPANIDAIEPSVSPRGDLLAFAEPTVDLNLWLYELKHPQSPRLIVPSTQGEYNPAFSPDGTAVAFVSDRSGAPEIWITGLAEGEPRQLTSFRGAALPLWPAWSPDGTKIAFFGRSKGLNYAYETALDGGVTRTLTGGESYTLFPQYAKDGKRIYYVSNLGHRFRIWTQPLASGSSAEPVVAEEVRHFRLSKDRTCLYFVRGRPGQLIRVDLATRNEQPVWTFTEPLTAFDTWDVSGDRLYFISGDSACLRTENLATGEALSLGVLRSLSREGLTGIAASPEGSSVLVSQIDSDDTKLMLMSLRR